MGHSALLAHGLIAGRRHDDGIKTKRNLRDAKIRCRRAAGGNGDRLRRRGVPDERHAHGLRAGGHVDDVIAPILVGQGADRRTHNGYLSAGERLTRLLVCHASSHFAVPLGG